MGQKVHPYGFRLGYNKTWRSRWYAERDYGKLLHEDSEAQAAAQETLLPCGRLARGDRAGGQQAEDQHPHVASWDHHRPQRAPRSTSSSQEDSGHDAARGLHQYHRGRQKPELDAQLVAESIALQLEKRIAFRRAMRKSIDATMRFGAKGIRVRCAGRLNGAEIARSEWYLLGQAAAAHAAGRYRLRLRRGVHHLRARSA